MSESQRLFFERCGIPSERIHVIQHGIDTAFFCPAARHKKPVFTVLSVGNYRRNFPRLLDVCELLLPQLDVRVKIVAPPEKKSFFSELRNVEFLSGLADEELRREYQDASCLLLTLEAATANNAVMEAMACGLPIISEDVGGISEYINSRCAQLRPSGDAEALCNAVLELKHSPRLRYEMSHQARKRALTFDWAIVAKRTLALYEHLLSNGARR